MRSDLRFLEPNNIKARETWDKAVWALPGGTVFHTTAWMDIIRNSLELQPRFAYLLGSEGSVKGLVPLFLAGGFFRSVRWLNVPQSCPSDVLAVSQSEAESLLGAVAAVAAAEGVQAIVLRTARDLRPSVPDNWEIRREIPVLRHSLNLAGVDGVERLPQARRREREKLRSLRRTLPAKGLTVRQLKSEEIPAFTRVLHQILLRSHGHLGLPGRFFEALVKFLPDAARLTIVGPETGPALGFVLCVWSPPSSYMLYGSGMPTKEGREAARWAISEEIAAAIRAGLQYFDMGETGPRQAGLIFYKEGWGAERTDGSYLILARKGAVSGLRVPGEGFGWVLPLTRRLPVTLALKIAGPVHRSLQ